MRRSAPFKGLVEGSVPPGKVDGDVAACLPCIGARERLHEADQSLTMIEKLWLIAAPWSIEDSDVQVYVLCFLEVFGPSCCWNDVVVAPEEDVEHAVRV